MANTVKKKRISAEAHHRLFLKKEICPVCDKKCKGITGVSIHKKVHERQAQPHTKAAQLEKKQVSHVSSKEEDTKIAAHTIWLGGYVSRTIEEYCRRHEISEPITSARVGEALIHNSENR